MSSNDAEKVPVPSQGGVPGDDKEANLDGKAGEGAIQTLDEGDIAILKTYVRAIRGGKMGKSMYSLANLRNW